MAKESTEYTITHEERRIIIVALAGFALQPEERVAIRPLAIRLIKDSDAAKGTLDEG